MRALELGGFNPLDVVLGVTLVFFGARGFMRGAVGEIAEAVGVVGGVVAGARYYQPVAGLILRYFDVSPTLASFAAFVAIFFAFSALVGFLGKLLRGIVSMAELSFVDRVGGFLLGCLKVLLVLSLVYGFLVEHFGFVGEMSMVRESAILSFVRALWIFVSGLTSAGSIWPGGVRR